MIRNRLLATNFIRIGALAVVGDNKAGWKLAADGKTIEMKDGNPVWIDANGAESTLAADTVTRLGGEAKQHRERAETLATQLKAFEGIKDPAKALKALADIEKIDQKKLIDAGEVDQIKAQIKAEYAAQMEELKTVNSKLSGDLDGMRIGNIFSNSEFVRDRIAVPLEMFKDSFSKFFKVGKDGDVEAYGRDGNRLMSKAKIGDYAKGDEALELLVEQMAQKDTILKPNTAGGTGNRNPGGRGGGNVMKRAEFDKLAGPDQAAAAARMNKGELSIVD